MEELDTGILQELQTMARQGKAVPEMLRDLIHRIGPPEPHKVTLLKYVREAFGLSLQQASPICGWSADGTGYLQDKQLDDFLQPEIARNRSLWD